MKRSIAAVIAFLLVAVLPVLPREHIQEYRMDGVTYMVIGAEGQERAMRMVLPFHQTFISAKESLFSRYNVRKPQLFSIVLCGSAAAFARMTGQNWYVAGIFDPESGRYYFQSPLSLRKRGILRTVISHELCHHILYRARTAARTDSRGMEWLDESFCEAGYPVYKKGGSTVKKLLIRIGTVAHLKNYIERGRKSSNRDYRADAYMLAEAWGAFLVSRLGERRLFSLLVNGMEESLLARELYNFKRRYRR